MVTYEFNISEAIMMTVGISGMAVGITLWAVNTFVKRDDHAKETSGLLELIKTYKSESDSRIAELKLHIDTQVSEIWRKSNMSDDVIHKVNANVEYIRGRMDGPVNPQS